MKVRPREAADQAAAEAFLTRNYSLRAARLGELVHPLDHPAVIAEPADGQLLGMLTYVPGRDWQQCEVLTLHADEQWRGAGTALVEAAAQLARRQGGAAWGAEPPTTTTMRCASALLPAPALLLGGGAPRGRVPPPAQPQARDPRGGRLRDPAARRDRARASTLSTGARLDQPPTCPPDRKTTYAH